MAAAMRYINLDYAASTPLRTEAIEAMRAYDAAPIAGANPNSLHSLGRQAAAELERARRDIARSLGASVRPHEVIFTGGGTEANYLALQGIARAQRAAHPTRCRIITSAIEHDSILDNLPALRAEGFTVDQVMPNEQGVITPDALAALLDDDVALVSCMIANNETGTCQPIAALAQAAHRVGASFHTDAIQGYLHIPFDVAELGVDALSIAGHKVGAPVACGALYLRRGTPYTPPIRGGGQEAGRRAGTQDVRAIVALAAVARVRSERIDAEYTRVLSLSNHMYERLLANPRIHATTGSSLAARRLPGVVSIFVDGLESEELILALDARGFCVSAGSACSSGSVDPSHVLTAMGLSRRAASGALRISFDDRVCAEDLDACCDALLEIVGGASR